jgi:hypothetical protein
MNFVIFHFLNSISFIICVKLLMALVVIDEPMDNHLYFHFNFSLNFLCTLHSLHALILRLLKLINEVFLTFALSSPYT